MVFALRKVVQAIPPDMEISQFLPIIRKSVPLIHKFIGSRHELTKKAAIVTGGGQGIGKAIVKRFLQEGMNVAIADIDEEAGKETEAEYKHLGSPWFYSD
jgi:FlaA1/EpsC-like NDP-sugar epimerase